ncbi:MAG: PASTA domain-containing protein [Myxococcales bacterium]|nr:PASTA domain-containing protein [Myxococcales bacterium]MCB9534896.1 PASTA domain-containing protein [Myxococcales bacterium]
MRQPREMVGRTVRMPELAGLVLRNARLMLVNAGFRDHQIRVRYEEAYRPEDEVIRQLPQPGALVATHESVELVVSRRSLLHHLPQVFQKSDRGGRHFLREFLWVFDHVFADLQRTIDGVHRYFDPLEAPPAFLDWLAGWVALTIDQDWPEAKQRRLIQQAIGIYGYRGTVRGLKLFLSIFTDVEPRVLENQWPYRGFRVGEVRVGLDSIVLPPVNLAHCFMVEVPAAFSDASDEMILKIHDIIRMERPAHTAYYLTFAAAPQKDALEPFLVGLGRVGIGESGVVAGTSGAPADSDDED